MPTTTASTLTAAGATAARGGSDSFTRDWIRTGATCGLLSVASYLGAAFLPLPDTLAYAAAFAFGPLLAVGCTGLYHCLAESRRTPLLQIAAAAAVAGGVTVLLMLTVQQSIFAARLAADGAAGAAPLGAGLNAVHLGLDVAWDVLIGLAVVLFGLAMVGHPQFGGVVGATGSALGVLLVVFNLWYFPEPPGSAGSIDWGPFVALWLLGVFGMLLRAPRVDGAARSA